MNRNLLILMIAFLMKASGTVCGMATIKFTNVKKQIGLYEPMFIEFTIDRVYPLPFDQTRVRVDALFLTPMNDTLVLPCFFKKLSAGGSTWEARFLPRMEGKYSVFIRVINIVKETSSKTDFTVTRSKEKGLLSFDPKSYYFLKFDNGERFRGIGLNVGWQYEPKWDNKQTTTFPMYFDAMESNKANFLRMWICPWNYPIEWTPVVNYQMLTDEFKDWSHMISHSPGLIISPGPTPVTQTDTAQLLKTTDSTESIVYRLDSVRKVKFMIYYKGNFSKDDIDILTSADNKNYQNIHTELSESWESSEGWKRIFLFSFDEIPQPANYIKFVFKKNIQKDNVKLAGIQFRYGKALSQLDCKGLSRYSMKNSMILDSIFDLAGKKGIHIMLTLGYHGQFNPIMDSWGANDEWQRNPYNKKNGGPCATPADFFSNPLAKQAYKNYLRYFVARWGYSSTIAAWEFWNEIDITARKEHVSDQDLVNWHKEMSDYLNAIDPFGHIITTSLSHGDNPDIWQLKNIDLTHVHRYQPSEHFVEQTVEFVNKYNKPHVIGEYAIGWKGPGNDFPDERYEDEFHDGLWRGFMSPAAILPMSWWWDYIYDKHQYFHFKALGTVLAEMVKQPDTFAPIKIAPVSGFQIYGISCGKWTLVWLKKMATETTLSVEIPVVKNGNYRIRQLNTRTNEFLRDIQAPSSNGKVVIEKLDLGDMKDMALIITII